MNFSLDEEQVMIRDSSRRFISERYTHEHWTAVAAKGGFDKENWQELANLGYLSIAQPESYGGIGGPVELALVCQEFGRGLLLEPYIGTAVFAARLIAAAGSERQKAAILPAIIQGESIVSVAYSEIGAQNPLSDIGTTARNENKNYILTGKKALVLAAPIANLLIVSARNLRQQAGALSLFIVDPQQAGISVAPARLLDGSWCTEVAFDNVVVPGHNLLGREGSGGEALSEALRYAILAVSAEMVGIIDRAFELAVEYTKIREQFGAPISTFQALRHRMADMAIDRELARSTLFSLLASFQDPDNHDPLMTASMAKAYLGEVGRRVCGQAIQLHGAMGMTRECGVGRYFARANVINSLFGQTDQQLETYTRLLAKQIKEGAAS